MENNEEPFEVEVQDEAQDIIRDGASLSREQTREASPHSKRPSVVFTPVSYNDNERTPLISNRSSQPEENPERSTTPPEQPWSSGFEHLPWYKRPSIFWLLPAFMPFCLAFGGLIVPKVNLILTIVCHDVLSDKVTHDPDFTYLPVTVGGDNEQCRIPEVQAQVAKFQLYMTLCTGVFSALVTPHFGALSDRIGRKKVITIAACGPFMNEIITIIVGTHSQTVSVYWLLLGAVCDGLLGSFTASSAVCYSYAADCTDPQRRSVAFGYFHGTLFTGIGLGPILAGYLIEWYGDIMIIFYVALGCHIFYIAFLNLFVPESLSVERQTAAREKRHAKMLDLDNGSWRSTIANYNFFEPLTILWPMGHGSSAVIRRNMAFLAAIDTLCFGVAMGTMNIIIIYADYVFGWSNLEASEFLSTVNISRVFSLLVFLPVISRLVRGKPNTQPQNRHGADRLDLNLIRVAILFDLLGYIGYASAMSGSVMIVSGMVAAFGGIASPTLQAALTKHVPPDRTGQLMGATGLLHALARVISPTIFNLIYAETVGNFTQTVFVCLASVFVLAEVLSWFLKPEVALPPDYQAPNIDPADRDGRYFIHRASSAIFHRIRRVSSGHWNE